MNLSREFMFAFSMFRPADMAEQGRSWPACRPARRRQARVGLHRDANRADRGKQPRHARSAGKRYLAPTCAA